MSHMSPTMSPKILTRPRYHLIHMHTFRTLTVVLALIITSLPASARPRVVAYVPNWVELTTFAGTIDYAKLTHINIAFENPTNDAGDLSFNKKDSLLIANAHAAGVKVLVSIGGGTASSNKTLMARH